MPRLPSISRWTMTTGLIALVISVVAYSFWPAAPTPVPTSDALLIEADRPRDGGMVYIQAGAFTMGVSEGPRDCQPAHRVELSGYWIDEHEVTNAQFARFIDETGFVTTAEQVGRSWVCVDESRSLVEVPGAYWKEPMGPDSTITGRKADPVVHVSWHDAVAYARWAGKQLPSEAQWERAARGGRYDSDFPWGRSEQVDKQYQANTWQGVYQNTRLDGFIRVAPAGHYPSNAMGLFDVAGNVREWCADGYGDDYYRGSPTRNPRGMPSSSGRVVRGGSWRSSPFNGAAHRVWVRRKMQPDQTNDHTGFRCVRVAPERIAKREDSKMN